MLSENSNTDLPAGNTVADASSKVGSAIKKPVNFSRLVGYEEKGSVRAVQAYYEPDSALPVYHEQPHIGVQSSPGRRQSRDIAWAGQRDELMSRGKLNEMVEEQRHPGCNIQGTSSVKKASDGNSDGDDIFAPGTSHAVPQRSMPIKGILKKTEVEQFSEHAPSELGESTGSHHTVSESGSGVYDAQGNWHASDTDTSSLSEKEVKKLEKKGINPALYLEMQQAKGKSVVGALTGNSFVG